MRNEIMEGQTYKIMTGCGNAYVIINSIDGKPHEVFINIGKTGGCVSSQAESTGRLLSAALQAGVCIKKLAKQLKGIRCQNQIVNGKQVLSCADAVGQCLEMYQKEGKEQC